ncbi:SusC/RagA family TonB-linked outer membrane protein [Mangrovibacterium lignilyticum]|uniref:SusC/RagA family TonB-linked outer membrane protein n=1 Tax=Mangrovibacterium lignilyticum TaxID=2668052 RepID=UPI0013D15591|nr:SusC/RagA family TonB-linked outer membrane protein [Mangrovibacterium lignilyticum]
MKKFLWKRYVQPDRWLSGRLIILTFLTLLCFDQANALSLTDLQKKVTVNFKDEPLKEVLNEVQRQSGIIIMYSSEKLDVSKKVTVNLKDAEVGSVLNLVLKGTGLVFEVMDSYILIKPVVKEVSGDEYGKIEIKGNVLDEERSPLPGATVVVKETRIGVTTDSQGNFSLLTSNRDTITLLFSFIGLKTKKVVYNGINPVKVRMERDNHLVEDVVVTGYQTIDESRVAGAVSKVKREDLNLNTINSIEQALQGKLPGVAITNVSGEVGTRQKTRVRGTSTFIGNQEPIWVVDGIIQEDPLPFSSQTLDAQGGINQDNYDYIRNYVGNAISWLNPNSIEDITVLKDASATAIYGVRAANGVIVVRTKQGEVGPLTVSYSMGMNIAEKVTYNKLELMNSRDRVGVSREIFERGLVADWSDVKLGFAGALNDYFDKKTTYEEFNAQVAKLESTNTDWFNILFRNPFSQSHTIGVSGGNSRLRVYSSLGFAGRNGTAIGNDTQDLNGSIRLTSQVTDKLNVGFTISGSKTKTDGFYDVSPYSYATKINRAIPAFDDNGDLYYYSKDNGYLYNFINERDQSGNANNMQTVNTNLNVNYNISRSLRINVLGSYNMSSTEGQSYATERTNAMTDLRGYEYGESTATEGGYSSSHLPVGGILNEDTNRSASWNFRTNLSYNSLIAKKHALTALLGFEMQSVKYDGYSSTVYGYLRDRGKSFAVLPTTLTSYGFSYANYLLEANTNSIRDRLTNNVGYYLTLNYAYDGRYVVNFSARGDASNRFGQYPNEKFNPVWAGGLRWNASREKWLESSAWLSDLSIRTSFGYQRSMSASSSPSLIVSIPGTGVGSASNQVYDVNTGEFLLNIKNLPYKDLRWEQTWSMNSGVDLSLFQNRVYVSANYYRKIGKDMISNLDIPYAYGVETMPVNGASMNNFGTELTVGFSPVRTKNFVWSLNFSTSKNKNEVTKVGTESAITWRTAVAGALYKKGYASGSFWAFKYDGVDPETGYPIIDLSVKDGVDPDKDPTAYMVYAGKADADFNGSISNSFRYKQLSLSASMYLQLGGKKFLNPPYQSSTMPTEYENLSAELNERWTPSNTNASLPGLPDQYVYNNAVELPGTNDQYAFLYDMYTYSTDRVVNASSLRVNYLSLSYNLSEKLCNKLNCKAVSLGLGVSNVFSIVSKDFHGRDPEVATGNQPRTRSYSLNLNVNF